MQLGRDVLTWAEIDQRHAQHPARCGEGDLNKHVEALTIRAPVEAEDFLHHRHLH